MLKETHIQQFPKPFQFVSRCMCICLHLWWNTIDYLYTKYIVGQYENNIYKCAKQNTCVYVCMYVSIYMCVCFYMYVCMYVCFYMYVCMLLCVCMYVCFYMYVCVYASICMYVCMLLYLCLYVYFYMYVCMLICVCMYVCFYMYVCMCACFCYMYTIIDVRTYDHFPNHWKETIQIQFVQPILKKLSPYYL